MQNAWNKYGEESFEFKIIEKPKIENLDKREIYWIDYYKNKVGVYNLESGGNLNKKINERTKKKNSKLIKEKWKEEEYYKKQLKNNMVQVICINTGEIYNSLTSAAKNLKVSASTIKLACEGKRNSVGGQKYGKPMQVAYYEKRKKYELKKIKNINRPKKIICVNTKEVFNSMNKAANKYKKYGCSQSKISMCCNGKREHNGKLENGDFIKWMFLKGYDSDKKYKFTKKPRKHNGSQKVKCLTTGEIFNSLKEAAGKLGVSKSTISSNCSKKGKGKVNHKNGHILEFKYI